MASLNKQQKRAKRAKIKAKQIRISGRPPLASLNGPSEVDELFDAEKLLEEGEVIPEDILTMFYVMQEEEQTSRIHMLVSMLVSLSRIIADEPDLLDMENAENEAMAATHLAADMLIDYRMWADGIDREAAQRWLEDPEVIKDFGTALDSYRQAIDIMTEPPKPAE
ncbi:hypothetical protein [Pseudomonas mandelii]|uniref:hypothetical protein n=1 Tax=Pseudomonas mandelii TaxID=75612 RepID=UPI00209E1B42|nr:hypothetical protein [Pseudomonas mandelii]MCO8310542.1 hypothetical protein [Pseudomonas mandelii]